MNEADEEKTPAPVIWCGKMYPELSALTKVRTLELSSKKQLKWPANKPPLFLSLGGDGPHPDALPMWQDNGALRGEFLMHSFGACPSVENASHLSQILEAQPHPKYSLSAKACLGILRRAENRGKELPEILKRALIQQAQRGGAYCIQGNCIDRADTAGCNGKGWTEGVSYTLNTIDRPAVLPFVPAPHLTGGANPDSLPIRSGTDNEQNPPQPNDEHREMPHDPQPGCPGDSTMLIFEPGSCTRVGRHIWANGKAPSLKADAGDNRPAVALEHHPNDSRLKIAEDGMVQTLNARMGTGGGNVPLIMQQYTACGCVQAAREEEKVP